MFPGAPEVPGDGIDQDCDGNEDCWFDQDGDTYGGTSTITTPAFDCVAPNATRDGGDCEDMDASIHPNATEIVADGIDQDCDGGDTCYQDVDDDGFGSTITVPSPDLFCLNPGEATNDDDCLDVGTIDGGAGPVLAADVNPNADEICNLVDDDCDDLIDDDDGDVLATIFWFPDVDEDGFGATNLQVPACEHPGDGFTDVAGDCNDNNPLVNPDATEVCDPNNVDEDCNGLADDQDVDASGRSVAVGAVEVHPDADGDGYGSDDPLLTVSTCDPDPTWVEDNTDCLDSHGGVNPGEVEMPYDRLDNDCDISTPDDDLDGDGYTKLDDGDCNDNPGVGFLIHPGATELPNGLDDNCDGHIDEGTDWGDDDDDGYTEVAGDCDDANPGRNPGAIETANNLDDDCDGDIDEDTRRTDDDGDGYTEAEFDCNDADPAVNPGEDEDCPSAHPNCSDGIDNDCDGSVDGGVYDPDGDGYTEDPGGDCDETNANRYPGAPELQNGLDDDCDGIIDEGTNAYDDDNDGWTENQGDCNDDDPFVNPDRQEQTNGVDDDCDGNIDEATPNADDDGDGFAENQGDCDDTNPSVNPAANEIPNGIDDNCNGEIDEGIDDLDEDGFTEAQGDCDDTNGWVNPGAIEVCDQLDNDCDGTIDRTDTGDDVCSPDDIKIETPGCQDGGGCNTRSGGASPLLTLLVLLGLARRRRAA